MCAAAARAQHGPHARLPTHRDPRPVLPRAVHGRARRVDRHRRAGADPRRSGLLDRAGCSGSSTPTRSPAPGACCSAAARRTCSGGARSSSAGSRCSGSPRSPAGWRRTRRRSSPPAAGQGIGGAVMAPTSLSILATVYDAGARAQPRVRAVGHDGRARRRVRRARRRRDHRHAVVALAPARQRAGGARPRGRARCASSRRSAGGPARGGRSTWAARSRSPPGRCSSPTASSAPTGTAGQRPRRSARSRRAPRCSACSR